MLDIDQLLFSADPKKTAIVFQDQQISYQQLHDKIMVFADMLTNNGIKPGMRIALFLLNCPELIIAYYACWKIGAVCTLINNRLKAPEIVRALTLCEPSLIIFQTDLKKELLLATKKDYPLYFIEQSNADFIIQTNKRHFIDQPQAATIHFTSGTTATPKAVLHHTDVLPLMAKTAAQVLNYLPEDELLVSQSLAHGFGYSMQMLPGLFAGCTLHVLPRFDAAAVFELIMSRPISTICLLPGFCFALLEHAKKHGNFSHHLRYCIVAGDTVPRALYDRFLACFGLKISANYGLTESVLLTLNKDAPIGCVGKPFPGVDIKIVDNNGQQLPPGEIGEIQVFSPYLFSEYLNHPNSSPNQLLNLFTAACRGFPQAIGFPKRRNTMLPFGRRSREFISRRRNQLKVKISRGLPRGFLTGDLGWLDSNGNLWLKGRCKLLISNGGSTFAPQEVEAACYQHPDILEAGVVSLPLDNTQADVIALVVVSNEQVFDKKAFLAFLQTQLAEYTLPTSIVLMPSLPKTSSGKLDRGGLITSQTGLINP